jgi:hypothetical protein
MRWTAFIALAILPLWSTASAQTDVPTREADDEPEHTAADVGPVQKHFVLDSTPDQLTPTEYQDYIAEAAKEKIALDKRIKTRVVHDVQNDANTKGADNEALDFELKYLNWGAVTNKQLAARHGHYFTITWENGGPVADFTACFEYRQVKSKEVVRTLTQAMPHVSGATRSYFAVVSKAYLANGPVSSWRFTVRKGDTVVAETKSYIW